MKFTSFGKRWQWNYALFMVLLPLLPVQAQEFSDLTKPVTRGEEINFPYLIEGDRNYPVVKIRCFKQGRKLSISEQRQLIRDSLLSLSNREEIIIEIDKNCRDMEIFIEEYHNYTDIFLNHPKHRIMEEDWLTRPGSGWDYRWRRCGSHVEARTS